MAHHVLNPAVILQGRWIWKSVAGTGLPTGKSGFLNPGTGKRYFSSPRPPDHVWGPSIPLFSGSQCSFPAVKMPGRDVHNSTPPSAQVKNKWSNTTTPPIRLYLVRIATNMHSLPLTLEFKEMIRHHTYN
jgi:hypothetical protein